MLNLIKQNVIMSNHCVETFPFVEFNYGPISLKNAMSDHFVAYLLEEQSSAYLLNS